MFALWPGDQLNFSIFIKPTFGFAGQPGASPAGQIANTNVGYVDRVPETYLKHLENTEELFEIRVQQGSDIFRIFCFFDQGQLVVIANGFQKKTQIKL